VTQAILDDSDSEEDLMAISSQATQGTSQGKTIKLSGHILKHQAVILVDSGSSHNFISEQLASLISNWSTLKKPMQVKMANGGILTCTHEVTDCPWLIQGVQFQTTFRILPLQCYDAILGMDWLEQFSPMEVQWAQKWLSFSHAGKKIQLYGLTGSINSLLPLSGDQLNGIMKKDEIWCAVQLYALDSEDLSIAKLLPCILLLVCVCVCTHTHTHTHTHGGFLVIVINHISQRQQINVHTTSPFQSCCGNNEAQMN